MEDDAPVFLCWKAGIQIFEWTGEQEQVTQLFKALHQYQVFDDNPELEDFGLEQYMVNGPIACVCHKSKAGFANSAVQQWLKTPEHTSTSRYTNWL